MRDKTLEELWDTAPLTDARFDASMLEGRPAGVRHYLAHALTDGAMLSHCVRLEMTGEIKLEDTWRAFRAEQVLRWDRGFVWAARAWVNGLPITGFDRLVDGEGEMRWKLLGLFPVVRAQGAEIARAAAGRMHAEAVWMPAVLLGDDVTWSEPDERHPHATIRAHGETTELDLDVDGEGQLKSVSLNRWGDLEDGHFDYHRFGAICEAEGTFSGVTIPTKLRVGWHFGSDRFVTEGEFFRCTVIDAQFR